MAKRSVSASSSQKERLREVAQKEIQGVIVFGRFITCLKLQPDIDIKTKLSVILGGGLQKWDLGLKLMGFGPFMTDGLILQKADVQNSDTIEQLCDLIFKWYRTNNWKVV